MSLKYSIVAGALAVSQALAQAPTTGASQAPNLRLAVQNTVTRIASTPGENILPLSESSIESYMSFFKIQAFYVKHLFKSSDTSLKQNILTTLETVIATAEDPSKIDLHEREKSKYLQLAAKAGIPTHRLISEIMKTPEGKVFLESLTTKTKSLTPSSPGESTARTSVGLV